MALDKKNIIVGAARVYLGPPSPTGLSATPAFVSGTRYATTMNGANGSTSTNVATLVTNWKDVGYTTGGLEIVTNPEWGEVEVDQLLDAGRIFKQNMTVNLNTTFAEATLENIIIAWGQAANTSSSVAVDETEADLTSGSLGEAPLERGFIAVGNGPENASGGTYSERVYYAHRVLSVESVSLKNSRNEAISIPVTFRALPADNAKYGKIRDRLNVT